MRVGLRPVFGIVATAALLASCSSGRDERARGACGGTELLVAASDYSSTLLCAAPGCSDQRTIAFGTDPSLSAGGGRAFLLARDLDVVFEIDPRCGTPKRSFGVEAFAGPNGNANPHDVAAAPDGTLVVALYNTPRLLFVEDGKVDPAAAIDLSSFDPEDGNPQANAVRIVPVGGVPKAFVSLERLDAQLRPTRPSQMLRVDVTTRAVEAVIELAGRNPFGSIAEHDGALFLAEAGSFEADDDELAGIERFDVATSTTKLLVRERDLGASVVEVAVTDGCGVAIVAGPEKDVNPTALVSFDPTTGRILSPVTAPLLATAGYDLRGLAWRGDTLYVGDRREDGARGFAVHLFERGAGCALTRSPRILNLPEAPVALRAAL